MENERYGFVDEKEYLAKKLRKKRNKKRQKWNIIRKNQKIKLNVKKKKCEKKNKKRREIKIEYE